MSLPLLAISVYLAAVMETCLASHWQVRGATPDLLVFVAFAWLTATARRRGLLPVALIGLASDLGSASPLGLGLGTFALVGYAVLRLKVSLHVDRLMTRVSIIWFAATSVAAAQGIGLQWLGETNFGWQTLAERCVLTGLFTAGIAAPVLMVAGWFRKPNSNELQNVYA